MKISKDLLGRVRMEVHSILPDIRAIRHKLHQCPEIAGAEEQTARLVRSELKKTSFELQRPLLGTDVIADLPGARKRAICLRADMDGLPICEETGVAYTSRREGLMHACGHDGHTAILLGTAFVLDQLKTSLPLCVRLIFQPGEEVACLGRHLVEAGACRGVEAAYALHAWPGLSTGCISSRAGTMCAAAAMFDITLTGKGCHGAMPHLGINPLPGAATVVLQAQEFHTEMNALDGSIISVCAIHGGESPNIIPQDVRLRGTARYFDALAGDRIEAGIRGIVERVALSHGLDFKIAYDRCYSLPVVNDEGDAQWIGALARGALGEAAWLEASAATTGAEDFAFYLPDRHGAMFWLGQGEDSAPLHNARFDFNDESLFNGIMMMTLLALTYPT